MYSTFQPFDYADWRIWFYLAAQLIGGIGLTLLLVTMIWPTTKRRPRNPLLISLCFSWWLSTFPCLCVLYYARQVTGPPPSYHVCLVSAALTMGQSILVATTAPALLFNIWLIVKNAVGSRFKNDVWIARSTLSCLIVPYVFFLAFVFASLAVGLRNPQLVHRALFYCVVDDENLTLALSVLGTVAMVAAIVMQLWTVVLLYQNRSCIRQLTNEGHISLVVRVCAFGAYVFLGLCLNVISIVDWTNPVPDLFYSTFGIAVFLVFGTQRDIWRLWCDASRTLASPVRANPHSHWSDHSQSPPTSPLRALGFGFSMSPRRKVRRRTREAGPYPLSTSQQHLSLSHMNYTDGAAVQSFGMNVTATQSQGQIHGQDQSFGRVQTQSRDERRKLSLSLSQFDYSTSFAQTVSYVASSPDEPVPPMPLPLPQPGAQNQPLSQAQQQNHVRNSRASSGGFHGMRISLPLPAMLSRTSKEDFAEYFAAWRDGVSVPSIVVQESTPDLAQDSGTTWGVRSPESPITPTLCTPSSEGRHTEWAAPVPEKGVRLLRPAGIGLGVDGVGAGTSTSARERFTDSPVLGVAHSRGEGARVQGDDGEEVEDENTMEVVELTEMGMCTGVGVGMDAEAETRTQREEDREEASTVASRYSCSTWTHPYPPSTPDWTSTRGKR